MRNAGKKQFKFARRITGTAGTIALLSVMLIPDRVSGNIDDDLRQCRKIESAVERLDCYDKLVRIKKDTNKPARAGPKELNQVLLEFSGTGMHTTRPFEAPGPWEVQWQSEGLIFQMFVHPGQIQSVGDIIANETGSGTGSAYRPRGGRYYLEISSAGSWAVRVISLAQ